MPAGHRTPAGQKARRSNLHRSEQRGQPPRADILERPLRPTMRADPPLPAIFLCLSPNKVILQSGECPFSVRQAQPDRCSRAFGCVAAAGADFVRAHDAVARRQLHYDAPLHPGRCSAWPIPPPRFETVSSRRAARTLNETRSGLSAAGSCLPSTPIGCTARALARTSAATPYAA